MNEHLVENGNSYSLQHIVAVLVRLFKHKHLSNYYLFFSFSSYDDGESVWGKETAASGRLIKQKKKLFNMLKR